MGRTILADDNIQTYVDKLLLSNTWYLGLLIGKLTNQKDYAIHLVRTPEPMADQASDDDEQDSPDVSRKRRRSQSKPARLSEMNEQWAATHAKQVTTMLPGGLSVIGIFAIAPADMMQSSQVKLRQILFAIQKMEKKSVSVDGMSEPITDRVLFQICQTTRKFTCRTIDVNDPKSTFRPADWKYLTSPEKWNRIETNLGLNLPVDVPLKSQNSTFSKQIQNGLQPFCKRVWNSVTLIDGATRPETELLDHSTEKKSSASSISNPTVGEYGTKLVLKGRIHSRAYVTGKATVQDGEQAIKTDVIRSVLSRCELLCDDIQVVEEDAETKEVYTTPRRVFFKLPGTSLELCDYMFQDEKLQEVTARIRELLDISLTEDDIDLSCERAATDEDCLQLSSEEPGEENSAGDNTQGSQGKYYLVAGIGGAMAFLVAGVSYFLTEAI